MTNKQKAREIAENNYNLFPNSSDITVVIDNNKAYCYESAMQAMQWKDEQLKTYLKEKWDSLAGNCCSIDSVRRSVVANIYEDLFNEKLTTNPETAR